MTPKIHRPYKILIISYYDNTKEITKFICLICLLYLDTQAYKQVFTYLKENYFFSPKIIHIDFKFALRKALIEENIFATKSILCSCFFHFSDNIRKRMERLHMTNKKFNKISLEILRNIKNSELYNFSFILYYAKNKDKVNYLKNLYLTNNIEESIHSKINYNLPKKNTTNSDFIFTVENIFINEQFKNKKFIRYDYVSQTLLPIIDDLNFKKSSMDKL